MELLDDAFSNSAHPQLSKQQVRRAARAQGALRLCLRGAVTA